MKTFVQVILLFLLLTACGSQNVTPDPDLIALQRPKPVILDVDMAHEDMFSALFLLSHPNVDLQAITFWRMSMIKSAAPRGDAVPPVGILTPYASSAACRHSAGNS